MADLKKTKGRAPDQENAAQRKQVHANHNATPDVKAIASRSTATDAQHAKLLALLRLGPQTTYSLRKHGIAQCAARIFHLRAEGHNITTERVQAIDSDGFAHVGVARYTLTQEKQEGQQ